MPGQKRALPATPQVLPALPVSGIRRPLQPRAELPDAELCPGMYQTAQGAARFSQIAAVSLSRDPAKPAHAIPAALQHACAGVERALYGIVKR